MPEHTIGTREEWHAARNELAKLESEAAERNEEIKRTRLELPWVPVEKEYSFETVGQVGAARAGSNLVVGPEHDVVGEKLRTPVE